METRHRSEKLKLDKEISLEQKRGEIPGSGAGKPKMANPKPSFQATSSVSKKELMIEDAAGTLLSRMGRKGLVAAPSPYETPAATIGGIRGKR